MPVKDVMQVFQFVWVLNTHLSERQVEVLGSAVDWIELLLLGL